MTDIPWIVSLDDHVVEPPDLWTSRLPARYRDVGPHVVMAPPGTPMLDGGTYIEAPGTEGEPMAWWFYEDQQYSVKRLIAAAGYPADEIGFDGITFDEMRPGCWQPQARIDDMTMNHVEASLCFPNYPRFCGQIFLKGQGQGARAALRRGLQRLDGRRVVRRQQRAPHPAVHRAAVGRRARGRRGASQRGARRPHRVLHRVPAVARPAEHPLRLLGPVLRARAPRPGTVVCMHIGSGTKTMHLVRRRSRRGAGHGHLHQQRGVDDRLPVLRRAGALPRPQAALRRGPDRLDPLRARARRRHLGHAPRVEPRPDERPRAAVAVLLPAGHSCFFKDSVGRRELLDRVGRRQHRVRDRLPAPGRHLAEHAAGRQGALRPSRRADGATKIVRGNAIRLLGLELGDGTEPVEA